MRDVTRPGWVATTLLLSLSCTAGDGWLGLEARPARLEFRVQPGPAIAGITLVPEVQVAVLDAAGEVVVTDTLVVVLSVSPAGALPSQPRTFTSRGIARFSYIQVHQSGTYTLTATSGGLASAVSLPFTVTSDGGSELRFVTQPAATVVGDTMPAIRVAIVDSLGRIDSAAVDIISLWVRSVGPAASSSCCQVPPPPPPPLLGQTQVHASQGVAIFDGIQMTATGTYSFFAMAPRRSATASAAFIVTQPASAGAR